MMKSVVYFLVHFACALQLVCSDPFPPPPTPQPQPQPSIAPTVAPVVLTNLTGSLSGTLVAAGQTRAWTLQPSLAVDAIELIFSVFSIGNAEFRLTNCENNADFGHELLSCIQCSQPIPPPFTIASNCLYISLRATDGTSFINTNFALSYIGHLSNITDATPSLVSYSLALPTGFGKISPTLAGGQLVAGATQEWVISSPNSRTLTLGFSAFEFVDNNCSTVISVYDGTPTGTLLYSGCRASDEINSWLVAASGKATVRISTTVTASVDFILTWTSDNNIYHCGQVLGSNVFLDDSMILTDGSSSFTSMRQGELCTFEISPSHPGQVILTFEEVNLLFNGGGATMTVWDSDGQTELWKVSITEVMGVVPPPIVSTGNSLFLRYASPGSNAVSAYGGFRGSYYVQNGDTARGEGDFRTVLKMSSALSISPPGISGKQYPSSLSYSWLIQPKTLVSSTITFVFSGLNLTDCNDVLTLYDGTTTAAPVLGTYCGGTPPPQWIKSGSAALLTFNTNSNLEIGTFDLSYFADGPNYHCGFTRNAASLIASSFTISDGSSSTEQMYKSQYCTWNISPHNATGVTLFFNRFDLDGGTLTIYNGAVGAGNVYAVISSVAAVPVPMLFPGVTTIGVEYSSIAGNVHGKGFSLTYFGDSESFVGPGDGIIKLGSSTLFTLTLPVSSSGYIVPGHNLTWLVTPDTSGILLFSFTRLNLTDCSRTWLNIYDGLDATSSALLGTYCGDIESVLGSNLEYWLATTQSSARIDFISLSSANASSTSVVTSSLENQGFEFGYYADGPNNHCGFINNPAVLNSPSFVVTDGSPSSSTLYADQDCEWIINPTVRTASVDSSSGSNGVNADESLNRIVLEFMNVDLMGGSLTIYDGMDDTGAVLYACDGCSVTPRPIVSFSNSVFVHYTSYFAQGMGFKFMYYTIVGTTTAAATAANHTFSGLPASSNSAKLLEIPVDEVMDRTSDNTTTAFHLGVPDVDVGGSSSVLTAAPRYVIQSSESVDYGVVDGRTGSIFPSQTSSQRVCGVVSSSALSYYADLGSTRVVASQAVDGYIYATRHNTMAPTTAPTKTPTVAPSAANLNPTFAPFTPFPTRSPSAAPTQAVPPSVSPTMTPTTTPTSSPSSKFDTFVPKSVYQLSSDFDSSLPNILPFTSATTCKYFLNSGTTRAINIKLERFTVQFGGRVRVYTGVYGNDLLAYDSKGRSSEITNVDIVAPCGLATILVDSNINTTLGEVEPNVPDYGLKLSYAVDPLDLTNQQFSCLTYIASLTPKPKVADPLLPLYYVVAGLAIVLIVGGAGLKLYRMQQEYVFNFKTNKRIKKIEAHPRFTPQLDHFRNRFLPMGTCVICGDGPTKMLSIGKCSHALCLDCMKSYLVNALGDISQFPVKCPMHYEGCTLHVDAKIAKRVLVESQYNRFLEFHDRSVHGDGMRCCFCNNFVTVDLTPNNSMVECPFCIQKFCTRCKKPWHYEGKCPLEDSDDSLEQWKKDSGAQKCPVCSKMIEKSDADTCNHMIHKITDGIPCIRERTDFCYCCGEEVLGDYPHDEVANPGVNHFPDGVFQKCLKLMQREREAERERLKKIKRQRNNAKSRMQARNENVVLPTGNDWDEPASPKPMNGGGGGGGLQGLVDNFDAWDAALPTAGTSSVPLSSAPGNPYAISNTANIGGNSSIVAATAQTVTPVHQRPGASPTSVSPQPLPPGPANTHNPVTGTGVVPVYHLTGAAGTISPTRVVAGAAAHRTTTVAAQGRGSNGINGSPVRTVGHSAAGRGAGRMPQRGRPGAVHAR